MMNTRPVRMLFPVLCLYACCVLLVIPGASSPCDWGGDYPYAGLTYEVMDAETLPVTVQFNSTARSPPSQDFTSWHWDFGDGTTSTVWYNHRSIEKIHPRHTYSTYQDHFDVCLKVTTQCDRSNEACERVQAYCTKPKAGFTLDVSEGPAPLMVHITDTSEHTPGSVTTWVYKKDGGTISTDRDFAGTFTDLGTYTITQTVKKNCNPSSDSFSRQLRVTGPTHGVVSEAGGPVTTVPTLAIVGVYFNFTNISSPVTTTSAAPGALGANARPPTLITRTPGTVNGSAMTTSSPSVSGSQTTPVPGNGSLSVTTDPAGAEVYIDGVLRGVSPATIPDLTAGTHMLRLKRQGYQVMTVPVGIPAGKTTEYSTALVPEPRSPGVPLSAATVVISLTVAGGFLCLKKKNIP